jgi:hypothetical protein
MPLPQRRTMPDTSCNTNLDDTPFIASERMKKTREMTFCGMSGCGPTRALARKDACRKLTTAMTGRYWPWHFRDRNHGLLVWREPLGWTYKILWPGDASPAFVRGAHLEREEFDLVLKAAVRHFAQSVYQETAHIPQPLADLLGPDDLAEHAAHCCWQRTYREAIERGYSDIQARDIASGLKTHAPRSDPRNPPHSDRAVPPREVSPPCLAMDPQHTTSHETGPNAYRNTANATD